MKITKQQLKQIIKEEISQVFAERDYDSVKDRQSDNYHAVRLELIAGMDIPIELVTDELIMAILRHEKYSDGDSIDAEAVMGGPPAGYGFTRQEIYDLIDILKS